LKEINQSLTVTSEFLLIAESHPHEDHLSSSENLLSSGEDLSFLGDNSANSYDSNCGN